MLKTNYVSLILLISAPVLAMERPPHLAPKAKPAAAIPANAKKHTCMVCFDEKHEIDCRKLSCGHKYCLACLRNSIQVAIDEKRADALKCIDPSCKKPIELADLKRIFYDKNHQTAIDEIQFRDWLSKQKNTKYCPTRNCGFSFINERGPFTHECPECKQVYCGQCLHAHPATKSCQQSENERKLANDRNAQERANEQWALANTKPCPQCGTRIEKNEGCMHMKCTNCQYHYCWNCLRAWQGHNNYYDCQNRASNPLRPVQQQPEQHIQITMENHHLLFASDPRGFAHTIDLGEYDFVNRFMQLSCEQQGEWSARITNHLEHNQDGYQHWFAELERLEPFKAALTDIRINEDGLLAGSIRFTRPVTPQFIAQFNATLIAQNPQDMILLQDNYFETSMNREQFQAALDRASAQFRNHQFEQPQQAAPAAAPVIANAPQVQSHNSIRVQGQQHPLYHIIFNRALSNHEIVQIVQTFLYQRREVWGIMAVNNNLGISFHSDRPDLMDDLIRRLNEHMREAHANRLRQIAETH